MILGCVGVRADGPHTIPKGRGVEDHAKKHDDCEQDPDVRGNAEELAANKIRESIGQTDDLVAIAQRVDEPTIDGEGSQSGNDRGQTKQLNQEPVDQTQSSTDQKTNSSA